NLKQLALALHAGLPQILDREDVGAIQVYEKLAQLCCTSPTFGDDEERVRQAITAQHAAIFSERSSGLAPQRSLALGLNVRPDCFDALLQELSQVGQLESILVQQQDRTLDFRRLHAQRQSLKKHLEAVLKLRAAARPSIEESLKLEQKVLEVE